MKPTHFAALLGLVTLGVGWNAADTPAPSAVRTPASDAVPPLPATSESESQQASTLEPPVKAAHLFSLAATAGTIAPQSMAALTSLEVGQTVAFSLPKGAARYGEIRLVHHDPDGWTRIGGVLADGATFSLSTRDGEATGRILLPREGIAYQLRRADSGSVILVERRLGDILCLGLPRRKNQVPPVTENGTFTVPLFDSRPAATSVLYLDFDGATVNDPDWAGGNTIVAPHARMNATQILKVCQHVAGDYASFNIDISTDATRYANTAVGHRMRAIITRNDVAASGAGGVALVDSFSHDPADNFSPDVPCWVFEDFAVDACAEALSHELGHTLGLEHDGRDFPNGRHQEYYPGQGRGATGWAPIMGVAYYRRLSQWSKGEYRFANNHQDDVAIIAGAKNGFGFITDEAGGTIATTATLAASGTVVDQPGVIANAQDLDVFRFITMGGKLSLRGRPDGAEGNIDVHLELLDSTGSVLQSSNPKTGLAAILQKNLAAGTYFVRLSGTGKGDPLRTGYTSYGSIGQYRITGKINGLQ